MMVSGRHRVDEEGAPGNGALMFAVLFCLVTLLLLSQIGVQTKFKPSGSLFAQPRFWPSVALAGMLVFGAAHLASLWRGRGAARHIRHRQSGQLQTILVDGVRVLEFALWFMAYVWITPLAGYLPSTLFFMCLLALRSGYRDWRLIGLAGITGAVIVLLFKTMLAVKIPGGAAYEMFPATLRALMIAYF
jgi:hypothetical protein